VLHRRTATLITVLLVTEPPMKRLAVAFLAVIVRERVGADEPDQTIQLANLVVRYLNKVPLMEQEMLTRFCSGVPDKHHLYSLFNSNVAFAVFVDRSLMLWASSSYEVLWAEATPTAGRTHNDPMPFHLMRHRLLLDDLTFALEAVVLLTEGALKDSIGRENLRVTVRSKHAILTVLTTHDVVLEQDFGVGLATSTMPDKHLHPIGMRFDLVAPLHDRDRRRDDEVWLLAVRNEKRDNLDGLAHTHLVLTYGY
jgi:hypothetical protein